MRMRLEVTLAKMAARVKIDVTPFPTDVDSNRPRRCDYPSFIKDRWHKRRTNGKNRDTLRRGQERVKKADSILMK